MSTQTEAQRIIQEMDRDYPEDWDGRAIRAELRRLDESEQQKSEAIQRLWKERDQLRELNKELLEALKAANVEFEYLNDPKGFVSMRQERIMEKARAAIAKAEERRND